MKFGDLIQERRKKLNLTQEAFLLLLGDQKKSKTYLTQIERHGEIPTPQLICRMAVVLGFRAVWLLEIAKKEKQSFLIKRHEKNWALLYNLITGLE